MTVSRRELAAAIAIPIVLAVLFLAPPIAFNLLVAAVTLAALWEFYRLAEKTGLAVAKTVGVLAGATVLFWWASFWGYVSPRHPGWIGLVLTLVGLVAFVFLASLAPLFAKVELPSALGGASGTVFGVQDPACA